MGTGMVPLRWGGTGAILGAGLNKEPASQLRLNPDLQAELEHIISKALEKDREIRYQGAAEIRADLKRLKRDTTSGRVSVAVAAATQAPKRKRVWLWAGTGAAVLLIAAALTWFFFPVSPPRVTGITQITHDGYVIGNMLTDGARIYFTQFRPQGLVLAQVSATGGETSAIPAAVKDMMIDDISAIACQLLVGSWVPSGTRETPLGTLPVPAGSPRRLGDVVGRFRRWAP